MKLVTMETIQSNLYTNYVSREIYRYDFNEPCCGKDQCDRESAYTKTLIRSFVDAGNDVVCAEDLYSAFHYGNGMKNTKADVVKIESLPLTGQKIPKVGDFHSFEFKEDEMIMWRYINVGEGVKQSYNNLQVQTSIKIVFPFHKISSLEPSAFTDRKKREERQLCMLFSGPSTPGGPGGPFPPPPTFLPNNVIFCFFAK